MENGDITSKNQGLEADPATSPACQGVPVVRWTSRHLGLDAPAIPISLYIDMYCKYPKNKTALNTSG